MYNILIPILAIFLGTALLTLISLLLGRKLTGKIWHGLIPGVVWLILFMYYAYLLYFSKPEGMEDLAYQAMMLLSSFGLIANLVTMGIAHTIFNSKRNKTKTNKEAD